MRCRPGLRTAICRIVAGEDFADRVGRDFRLLHIAAGTYRLVKPRERVGPMTAGDARVWSVGLELEMAATSHSWPRTGERRRRQSVLKRVSAR